MIGTHDRSTEGAAGDAYLNCGVWPGGGKSTDLAGLFAYSAPAIFGLQFGGSSFIRNTSIWGAVMVRIPRIEALDKKYPFIFVDGGAAEGFQKKWSALDPHLRVIGFEPDSRSFAKLDNSNPKITYINAGLGRKTEIRTFYLTRNPTASSTFPPNKEFFRHFPEAERVNVDQMGEIPLVSMDEALRQKFGTTDGVDFVKLDVHGIELEIIQGAREAIASGILGFEIEVCIQPLFGGGAAMFNDINAALIQEGFELFDLRPWYYKRNAANAVSQINGQLVYGDALYFRSPERILKLVKAITDRDAARAKALHGISSFLVFGYSDCAHALANYCADLFTSSERVEIAACIKPTTLERLRGLLLRRSKLHRIALWLADLTDPRAREWRTAGRYLGNSQM
jgi:FkbM family methyltransferase